MKTFEFEVVESGIELSLSEKKRGVFKKYAQSLKVSNWDSAGDIEILKGLVALNPILQELGSNDTEKIVASFNFVAELSDLEASSLNLPPASPYQLRVYSTGSWTDNSYNLSSEFLDNGRSIYVDNREGCFIYIGNLAYRIPSPLYEIIEQVALFPESRDGKLEAQSKINKLFTGEKRDARKVSLEQDIINMRIRHVSGFSSTMTGSLEDPTLSPVLFAKHSIDEANDTGNLLDESQQILDEHQLSSFGKEFFSSTEGKSTYVLSSGEYVYIDPSVRPALGAFRRICSSDAGIRKSFLKSPNATLANHLSDSDFLPEDLIEKAFIATAQFSERVIGINQWIAPELPWFAEVANDWGTETLIFEQLGGALVRIPKSVLHDAIHSLEMSLSAGDSTVTISGVSYPASRDLLQAMREVVPEEPDESQTSDLAPDKPENGIKGGPFVAESYDNFEIVDYKKAYSLPKESLLYELPRALVPSTIPMPHQITGLKWLVSAFNVGMPGVLNADDMGLGKTLQALMFLALYQQQMPSYKVRPCLIVAPKGLLNNWLKEIDIHLVDGGLGAPLKAFGTTLKNLKNGSKGKDTDFGLSLLDIAAIQQSSLVLTTYETLRDYHVSFARVEFGVTIFDEIQKAKNPKSLITICARTVNSQIQIGLSGTPVENSLADLWTIMDVLAPGLLSLSLKEFLERYSGSIELPETLVRLEELKNGLLEPDLPKVPPILRRMKVDIFRDGSLPEKILHSGESTTGIMPPEQAKEYKFVTDSVNRNQLKKIQGLHQWKMISLSPRKYDALLTDRKGSILASAKLIEFFKILDSIHLIKEKALVFLESRALQPILCQLLKDRYSMAKVPLIINGAISGKARQDAVDIFQDSAPGFNVILISPKAGGVGLTLTAANHVIHLERWWNPAVEDQCNDRAYRIGQTKPVNIYTPLSKYPVEEVKSFDLILDGILERKRGLALSLFVPTELSPDDFSQMFDSKEETIELKAQSPEELQELESEEDFEDYVANSLYSHGFTVIKTKRSWDGGSDLIAAYLSNVVVIQCKQVRSDNVLQQSVNEVVGALKKYSSYNPTHSAVITNAHKLTSNEIEKAFEANVILIKGSDSSDCGTALKKILVPLG